MTPDPATCPRCGAPRASGPECPTCGVLYAKARPRDAPRPEPGAEEIYAAEIPAAPGATWKLDADELALEKKLRLFAVPAALAVSWLLMQTGLGHSVGRIFASMWIHELGHAVTAWACGLPAFPGPWVTRVGTERSALVVLLWAGGAIYLGVWAWRSERRRWILLSAALLIVQIVCSGVLSLRRANELTTFAGDGGRMVLGTALVMTFYARAESQLRRGWLRWGFLAIGAIALMDGSNAWWSAARDSDKIMFGMQEGVGLSDPSKLQDLFGWSTTQMVRRYVTLSLACLAALFAVYAWGTRHADVDSSLPE